MTTKSLSDLSLGASVMVKPGVKDPDTGDDIGGWQGRVSDFGEDEDGQRTIDIAWDSLTLKGMSAESLAYAIREGLDWQVMFLGESDLEAANARDTAAEVARAIAEIEDRTEWQHLDEDGRIQSILAGINPRDTMALLIAWEEYLEERLQFPFEAEVSEW